MNPKHDKEGTVYTHANLLRLLYNVCTNAATGRQQQMSREIILTQDTVVVSLQVAQPSAYYEAASQGATSHYPEPERCTHYVSCIGLIWAPATINVWHILLWKVCL